ncbi:hypothetical protein B0H16DRAFT_1463988 [Mycena metata]|uniref:Uncharacterized protein n=1 Tax=Mycena metata TaxID=1033252 RepID=A0AAD7IGE2_9AGAR|nr:hypothetical protein B0H16DRAFT_1463988 [Mycena metata]
MHMLASTWALCAAGLLFALPMIYLRIKDHTELEDETINMSAVRVSGPKEHLAMLDVPCGRRGCTHFFRYEGNNPVEEISAMLKTHASNCPGYTYSATPIEWQTRLNILRRLCNEPDDAQSVCYTYGRLVPKLNAPNALPLHKNPATDEGSTSKQRGKTIMISRNGTKRLGRDRASNVNTRRAALNIDPYALSVTARDVTCRGCTKIATLNKFEEYVPERWIKHRNRCRGVKKQRSVELAMSQARRLKEYMQSPGPEPIYQPTTLQRRRRITAKHPRHGQRLHGFKIVEQDGNRPASHGRSVPAECADRIRQQ